MKKKFKKIRKIKIDARVKPEHDKKRAAQP